VADVAQVDLVADVYEAVSRAIEDGTTLEDFQDQIGDALEESWGGEEPGRLENIFRTNVMGAYNAGRYEAATAPAVLAERPYWRMDGIGDDRQTEICQACDGVVLPADHPWWQTHYPPLHFQCRDHVTTLTEEQARDAGITSSPPAVQPEPGFGAAPSGEGSDWEPDTSDLPGPLERAFEDET
jgi:SPP1 gp7 family putative phage head morphogenesis protein